MNRLSSLLTALVLLAPIAAAEGLQKNRIPAGARWVAHLDVQALRSSKLFALLREESAKDGQDEMAEGLAEIRMFAGLDPTQDFQSVTLYSASSSEEGCVALLAGDAKIDRALEKMRTHDFLVEMKVSSQARRKDPSLPERWVVRALSYQYRGFQPQWLLTSLLDAAAYPAPEIAALYHERWEIELGYDEIKTEMLDREDAIRSQSPQRIGQEVWGILLAFNPVRLEMERIADEARVEPTRISFITALHLICDEWIWSASASPGAIPRHLRNLRAKIQRFILPPRRSERRYPRAVKIKMSSYPRKRRPPSKGTAK